MISHVQTFLKSRAAPFLALAIMALIIAAARVHTYSEPPERDITTYAVIAHGMLEGRPLYSEMWDIKPPAVFVTYALGEMLTSYGPASLLLLGVTAAIITLLGVYAAGAALCGKASGGLWAAAFWTLICSDLYLQANQPNTEAFINACAVWAFALFARSQKRSLSWRAALLMGVLFALGSLYKQVALAAFLALACAHVLFPPAEKSATRKKAAVQMLGVFVIIIAGWLGTFAYFKVTGGWTAFYNTIFVIGSEYAGNPLLNLVKGLQPSKIFSPLLFFAVPLALLVLVGLVISWRNGDKRRVALLLALVLGTQIAVALPGQFNPHYYQLWLPVLAIGAGCGVAAISQIRWPRSAACSVGVGVLACLLLLAHEAPFFRLSADDWSRAKYGEFFINERTLAREIDRMLEPGETFYEYGRETGLYWHSKRQPPTGVIINFPVQAGPLIEYFSDRVIDDLSRSQPEMLVICRAYPMDSPVINWLVPRYEVIPGDHERGVYTLLARRGGKLEKRLLQNSSK